MNTTTLTEEQKKIWRLERCIEAFKTYDERRKKLLDEQQRRIEALTARNDELVLKVDDLTRKIESLIDAYDHAGPMKDDSGRKAYVMELLDRLNANSLSTRNLETLDSVLAREVVSLRKGIQTLTERLKKYKEEINRLNHTTYHDKD